MKRKNLLLLFITSASSMVFGTLYLTLLPQYTKANGYDELFYGILFSLNMAAFVVLSIPGGHLSDKIGRRYTLFIGWSLQAVTPLMLIFSAHPASIITTSIIWGLGSGFSHNSFSALIADSVELGKLSRSYGYIFSISLFISAGSIFGVETFILETRDIQSGLAIGLFIIFIIAVASAVISLLFKEEPVEKHDYTTFSLKQFSRWEKRVIRDFAVAQFVIGFGAAITVPYYALFFLDKFNTSPVVYGLILAFGQIAIGITQLFSGYVGDKVDKLKYLVFANAMAIPMAFGIFLAPSAESAGVFYMERVSFANMAWPVWNAFFMAQIARKSRGKAQGMVHIFWNLAYIPGPIVGGLLAGINPGMTFPIAAVMYLLVMLFVFYDLSGKGSGKRVQEGGN